MAETRFPDHWPAHVHPWVDGVLDCRKCLRCHLEVGWREAMRETLRRVTDGVRPLGGNSQWNDGYKYALRDALNAIVGEKRQVPSRAPSSQEATEVTP